MHEEGIMHRDIKPQNIILKHKNNPGIVKLADLGLATYIHEKEHFFNRCGTPGYIAPEIISLKENQRYDEKCDVYSAAVIFYQL